MRNVHIQKRSCGRFVCRIGTLVDMKVLHQSPHPLPLVKFGVWGFGGWVSAHKGLILWYPALDWFRVRWWNSILPQKWSQRQLLRGDSPGGRCRCTEWPAQSVRWSDIWKINASMSDNRSQIDTAHWKAKSEVAKDDQRLILFFSNGLLCLRVPLFWLEERYSLSPAVMLSKTEELCVLSLRFKFCLFSCADSVGPSFTVSISHSLRSIKPGGLTNSVSTRTCCCIPDGPGHDRRTLSLRQASPSWWPCPAAYTNESW